MLQVLHTHFKNKVNQTQSYESDDGHIKTIAHNHRIFFKKMALPFIKIF